MKRVLQITTMISILGTVGISMENESSDLPSSSLLKRKQSSFPINESEKINKQSEEREEGKLEEIKKKVKKNEIQQDETLKNYEIECKDFEQRIEEGRDYAFLFLKKYPHQVALYQEKVNTSFIKFCKEASSTYETYLRQIMPYCSWFPKNQDKKKTSIPERMQMWFARLDPHEKKAFGEYLSEKEPTSEGVVKYLGKAYSSKQRFF